MFINAFLKLFAGTAAVQIITIIFYPILGRLYTPENFGEFGFYTSASLVLSIFASGQLHMAFPKLKSQESGLSLGELTIAFSLFTCSLVALVLKLGMSDVFHLNQNFWWVVPLFAFSLCLNEVCKMWLVHLRKYGNNSIFTSSNRLVSNFLKVLFPARLGLIYSEIVTNLFLAVVFLASLKVNPFRMRWKILKAYHHYPTFYTFGALAQSLQQELPIFIFRSLYPVGQIGIYVMANRFTVQSVLLVTSSVVLLLANQDTSAMTERQLRKEMGRVLRFGVPLALLCFITLTMYGDNIFMLFLGKKWAEVGVVSSYLVLLTIPKMLFTPLYARFLKFGEVRIISIMRLFQIIGAGLVFAFGNELTFYSLLFVYVLYDFLSDMVIVYLSYNYLSKVMESKNVPA